MPKEKKKKKSLKLGTGAAERARKKLGGRGRQIDAIVDAASKGKKTTRKKRPMKERR